MTKPNAAQRTATLPPWHSWSGAFVTQEIRAQIERLRAWPDVERVITLPDVHLAGETLNGAVVVTREEIYPSAVGADIGCGMRTQRVRFSDDVRDNLNLRRDILATWRRGISIFKTPRVSDKTLPDPSQLSSPALASAAQRDGLWQLGSLGRGNHFLELQVSSSGDYWLLVHSGSRAMGQIVTAAHTRNSEVPARRRVAFPLATERRQDYLSDHDWCRRYASASRAALLARAVELLADLVEIEVDRESVRETDHNHLEVREGFLVHRKGAQKVAKGEWGIVPGSSADATIHIEGRGSAEAFDSCSHGAGRRLSRTQASQSLSLREVRRSLAAVTTEAKRLPQMLDEAPDVYRDIEAVMRAQRALVKRTLELTPLLTLKGGR